MDSDNEDRRHKHSRSRSPELKEKAIGRAKSFERYGNATRGRGGYRKKPFYPNRGGMQARQPPINLQIRPLLNIHQTPHLPLPIEPSFQPFQPPVPILPGLKPSLEVTPTSDIEAIANIVTEMMRRNDMSANSGDNPHLIADTFAIFNAIKGITLTRNYLEPLGLDIRVSPEFKEREQMTFEMTLLKSRRSNIQLTPIFDQDLKDEKSCLLRISKGSKASGVAGAIARKIRSGQGFNIQVVSIGKECTLIAVHSLVLARIFLENDGWELCFRPVNEIIQNRDSTRSDVFRFYILPAKV